MSLKRKKNKLARKRHNKEEEVRKWCVTYRQAHPDWSDEKVLEVAFASAQGKNGVRGLKIAQKRGKTGFDEIAQSVESQDKKAIQENMMKIKEEAEKADGQEKAEEEQKETEE